MATDSQADGYKLTM